jgi:hypothetical protein
LTLYARRKQLDFRNRPSSPSSLTHAPATDPQSGDRRENGKARDYEGHSAHQVCVDFVVAELDVGVSVVDAT